MLPLSTDKIRLEHLERQVFVYVRQSTPGAVRLHLIGAERQYDMRQHAIALGWQAHQIHTIDKDQGRTGTSTFGREGFKEILAEIIMGNVGAIFCLEVSRLARDSSDFQYLIKACAMTDTLIIDEQGIYDLSNDNDRLLLGIKGTLFEAEHRVIKARLLGARLLKAQKGELRTVLPIGYIYDRSSKIILDPDEEVRQAVHLVFELFEQRRSANSLVKYFSEKRLLFPKRTGGAHNGEVVWEPPNRVRLLSILRNPTYAGVYAYGRTRKQTCLSSSELLETKRKTHRVKFENWLFVIRDHHVGYITWERYLSIQQQTKDNTNNFGGGHRGAIRSGAALLQGIVLCGKCGRRMRISYPHQTKRPAYVCSDQHTSYGLPICQRILSTVVDRAVSQRLLRAIAPAQLEMSLNVAQQIEAQSQRDQRQRELHIKRAEYESDLAYRRYKSVDPENRLVARNLERELNDRLAEVERLKYEDAELKKLSQLSMGPEESEKILALAQKFPHIWQSETTTNEQRKRLLRHLIIDVTLTRNGSTVHIGLRWRTNAYIEFQARLTDYDEVRSLIRQLVADHTDQQIADHLNSKGMLDRRGNPFNQEHIARLRYNHGISRSLASQLSETSSGHDVDGHYSRKRVAELLNITESTVGEWVKKGLLTSVKAAPFRFSWILLTPQQINDLRKPARRTYRKRNSNHPA